MSTSPSSSGLDHLVEAATALTQLVRTQHNASSSSGNNMNSDAVPSKDSAHPISDESDSDSKSKKLNSNSTVSSLSGSSSAPAPPSLSVLKSDAQNAKEIFPRRLFSILSDNSISEIITWLPHGRAFVILKTDELAESVLPKYFPESCANANSVDGSKSQTCKYPSFTRKLNRWGFRQVTRGPDSGAFHHKFFIRDEPDLCLKMVCQRSKRRKSEKNMNVGLKKIHNIMPANSALVPGSNTAFVGPYSAALRQQPMDHVNMASAFSVVDQNRAIEALKQHVGVLNNETVNSCNTPPPTSLHLTQQLGNGKYAHIQPNITSPSASENQSMSRTVSTNSSSMAPGAFVNLNNSNFNLPMFSNEGGKFDPRLLMGNPFANNQVNTTAPSSSFSQASAPNASYNTVSNTSTNITVNSNSNALQQQNQAMPNYITFFDNHVHNNQQMQQHHQQQQQQQQSQLLQTLQSSTNQTHNTQTPNCVNYHSSILPLGTTAANVLNANNVAANPQLSQQQQQAAAKTNLNMSNQSTNPTENGSNCTVVSSNSASSTNNGSNAPPQQQTEAELRAANAKSLLYNAYLKALG